MPPGNPAASAKIHSTSHAICPTFRTYECMSQASCAGTFAVRLCVWRLFGCPDPSPWCALLLGFGARAHGPASSEALAVARRGIRPGRVCAGCTRAVGRAAWRASPSRTFACPCASGVGSGVVPRLSCPSLSRSLRGAPRVAALSRCPGRGIRLARGRPFRGGARVRWARRRRVPWRRGARSWTPLVAPHNTPPRVCPLWRRWPRRDAPRACAGRGVQGLAARRARAGRQPA